MDMTPYESERERVAASMDIRLDFKSDAAKNAKTQYSLEEIYDILDQYAEKVKIHK